MELSGDSLIPDVMANVPGARGVLDRYGLRGCGGEAGPHETLEFFARVHGVALDALIEELKHAPPEPAEAPPPDPAETLYRAFFKGGIVVILTAGASLGALALVLYGLRGSFAQSDVFALVQAHANAQVYGWVGLFVMGFAIQALPRFKYAPLHRPDLASESFTLMAAGLVARVLSAMPMGAGSLWLGFFGGVLEAAAAILFVYVMIRTLRKGTAREAYDRYVTAALVFFALAAAIEPALYYYVFSTPDAETMRARAAAWSGPYRDLQLAGFAAFMIFGVSQRLLPTAFGFRAVPETSSKVVFLLLLAGLALSLTDAAAGHALYVAGAVILAAEFGVFGPAERGRATKFVRAAYAWLLVAGALLLFAPLSGSSHAWIGAYRHAFTVGFISMMIVGVSLKIVPILTGADPARLPAMTATFWLLNVGNAARVASQIATDHAPWAFRVMGFTGFFEVLALAIWGVHLWRVLDGKFSGAAAPAEKPSRIEGSMIVARVIGWWPETLEVFVSHGFTPMRNPVLRATLGRGVTIGQACRMHGVDEAKLLEALNAAATGARARE